MITLMDIFLVKAPISAKFQEWPEILL